MPEAFIIGHIETNTDKYNETNTHAMRVLFAAGTSLFVFVIFNFSVYFNNKNNMKKVGGATRNA